MNAPIRTVPPAETPVTLAEAKAHLRVDFDEDDALIGAILNAATEYLDGWDGILSRCLVTQTWTLNREADCDFVAPFPQSLLVSETTADGVTTATFTSGYGGAAAVPAAIKAAILLHVGTLYEYRGTMAERVSPTGAYEALIAPYRYSGF